MVYPPVKAESENYAQANAQSNKQKARVGPLDLSAGTREEILWGETAGFDQVA
jgi:hypothetical protein